MNRNMKERYRDNNSFSLSRNHEIVLMNAMRNSFYWERLRKPCSYMGLIGGISHAADKCLGTSQFSVGSHASARETPAEVFYDLFFVFSLHFLLGRCALIVHLYTNPAQKSEYSSDLGLCLGNVYPYTVYIFRCICIRSPCFDCF